MIKIMEYLKNKKIKKFICFTTILLYQNKNPNKKKSEKDMLTLTKIIIF